MEDELEIGILSDSPGTIRQMIFEEGSCTVDLVEDKVTWLQDLPEPFVEVIMTCGAREAYKVEDIPQHSLPCSCGNPSHWIIKYRKNLRHEFKYMMARN